MRGLTIFVSVCIAIAFCRIDYEAIVTEREDINISRLKAYTWLLSQRNDDWGWGTKDFPETHRILTALYLSGELKNGTDSLEYQLSKKQLELELSLALARTKEKVSAGKLALYANALLATCKDPNDFYGHNLIELMRPQKKLSVYSEGLVSLAVYNSGNNPKKKEVIHNFELLVNYSGSFDVDTKAMLVLALSSAATYREFRFIKRLLREPLKEFKQLQKADGSFGNIYSTALAVQALIGAGDKGKKWSFQNAMDYILLQQKPNGSFGDMLATYFTLPVLAGRSLVYLKRPFCGPVDEVPEDDDLEDGRQNGTIVVRYSVSAKKIRFSRNFEVPEGSTFYDVMVKAQKLDNRYRFNGTSYSWGYFVQEINGIRNDQTSNRYWMLYKENKLTGNLTLSQNGVTTEIPENGDHYIFRYTKMRSVAAGDVGGGEDQGKYTNSTTSTTEARKDEGFEAATTAPYFNV